MTPLSELLDTIANCDSIDELNRWVSLNEKRLCQTEIYTIEDMIDKINNRIFDWFDNEGLHDTNIEYPTEVFDQVRKELLS